MSSSIWGFDTRTTDDGNQSMAFYQKDALGFDVGAFLAATRNDLPLFDPSRLTHDTILGSGTSFDVHRELFSPAVNSMAYFVAVKYIRMAASSQEDNRQRLGVVIREIRVMMHPALRNHKCIIPLFGYAWKNDLLLGSIPYLVTEYSSYGTLRTYLEKEDETVEGRQDFAMDVALAIGALHAEGIIHGDVKLENVLVFRNNNGPYLYPNDEDFTRQWHRALVAKLADFGSVAFASEDVELHRYAGTPAYNPPELQDWFPQNKHSRIGIPFEDCKKADIYSFGLLLWEVMNQGKRWFKEIPEYNTGEEATTLLERLYKGHPDTLREYASSWADARRLLHSDHKWSDTTKDAFKSTVRLCLKGAAVQRADMHEVIASLGHGTSTKRQPPAYPLPAELQYTGLVDSIPDRQPAPYGYYFTDDAPDIAIPNSHASSPYLRRYNYVSGEWELTNEIDNGDLNFEYIVGHSSAPELVERMWVNPQAFDLFEATAATSPPWSVQCEVVRKLKEGVLRENDNDKKAQAHLQLSLCLHIGFGIIPDASKVVFHLQEAAARGSDIANTMKFPVQAAFQDSFIQEITVQPKNEGDTDTYVSRAQRCVLTKTPKMLAVFDSYNPIPARESAMMQDMVQACQKGSFQDASTLATKCSHLGTFWSRIWPTPVHWLFMFEPEQAKAILDQLLVGSQMAQFEHSSQKTVYIPELALELFGSPLMWATRLGDVRLSSLLLEYGANADFTWRRDLRPERSVEESSSLHYSSVDLAAIWHHAEVLGVLLECGASIQGGGVHEKHPASKLIASPVRPLARQVVHGVKSRIALKKTLETLAEYDKEPSMRISMLEVAFAHCDQDLYILEELVAYWQASHLSGQVLVTAVKDASIRRCSLNRLNVALPLAKDVNAVDADGKTALQYAAEANSAALADRLLADRRVDYNASASKLPPPIALAAKAGAEGVVDLLISAGADPDAVDGAGMTPLQHALASRSVIVAARLIDAGAVLHFTTPALRDRFGTLPPTALFLATSSEQKSNSMLAPLLKACPRLREKEMLNFHKNDGWTVLHQAVWYGDLTGVCELLEAGADPWLKSSNGLPKTQRRTGTPLQIAVRLSDDLTGIGDAGWRLTKIPWLSKGGAVAWKSYLGRLEGIIGALDRVPGRSESET